MIFTDETFLGVFQHARAQDYFGINVKHILVTFSFLSIPCIFDFFRCMMRRMKVDVISQLPSKQRQMVELDPAIIGTKKDMQRQAIITFYVTKCRKPLYVLSI